LLGRWRPGKHELLHFIAAFLDRNLWIKQSRASIDECLIKVVKSNYSCRKGVENIFEGNDVLPNDE
jgi:hypothetical protein